VVSSDEGVVVRQSLFLCPYLSPYKKNYCLASSYYTPSSWSSTHLSCFLYNKRDIYLVQILGATCLAVANQYVRIAAGEFVLHLSPFYVKNVTTGLGTQHCGQFVWQLPINIRSCGTDPILVLQILSQNFNKKKLNNIWWVI